MVTAIVFIAAALMVFASPFLGWNIDVVLSGSMEPAIQTGGVVVILPVDPETVKVGDVVTYASLSGKSLTTHRVIAIQNQPERQFITKGDANKNPDPSPILPSQIVGIVVFSFPFVGYLITYIRTPLGLALVLGVPALLIVGSELKTLVSKKEE
jgi:signal peptidase